jgi:Ca2+-dependent lipid-binding protein
LEIWNSFLESWAVGDLKVKLIKAEDIIHTHHVGNVDLFVDLSVHQIQVERSTFKKSSKGPAFWHETFTVQVISSVVKGLQRMIFSLHSN